MVYITRNVEDEDKKEKNDSVLGINRPRSAPSLSSPVSGGSSAPIQPKPSRAQGTGFTNLGRYLDAGRGRDAAIGTESGKLIGNESKAFGQAYQGAYEGLNKVKPIELSGGVSGQFDNAKPGQGGPSISQVLGQEYNGPDSIGYVPGEDYGKAQALGDKSTISSVLVNDPKNKANYTGGMRSLDEALYGADPASVAASKKSVKDLGEFTKQANVLNNQFSSDVNSKKEQIQKIKDDTLGQIKDYNAQLASDIQARANAVNERDAAAYANQSVPEGSTLGQWSGSAPGTANLSNQMTDEEQRRLSILSKYLGYNSPVKSNDYIQGKYDVTKNPLPRPQDSISDYDKEQLTPVIMDFANQLKSSGGSFADNTNKIANVLNYIRQFNKFDPARGKAMSYYLTELIQRLDISPSDKKDFIDTIRSNAEGK